MPSAITCYKRRCGHDACREAWNAHHRNIARLKAYGRWDPWADYTDAEPVREHVRALSEAGIGLLRLAEVSGVSEGALRALLYGDEKDGLGPTKRIHRDRARAILAVTPSLDALADGGRVSASGTRRRLQALAAVGWSSTELAKLLGKDPRVVARTQYAETVTGRTARTVRDLYERLWDQAPPESTATEKMSASRARTRAQRRGWVPPLAWDDETIDDPAARPNTLDDRDWDEALIDEVAVELALTGERVNLSDAEFAEVVRIGTERGMSAAELAEATGRTKRSVQRRRAA